MHEREIIYEKIYNLEDIIAAQNEELNNLRKPQLSKNDTLRVVCLGTRLLIIRTRKISNGTPNGEWLLQERKMIMYIIWKL